MARIKIDLKKIKENFSIVAKICEKSGLELILVTKCCGGDRTIIDSLIKAGAKSLAETMPMYLKHLNGDIVKSALHAMPGCIHDTALCDYVYVTDIKTVEALSRASSSNPCRLMVPLEFGDLREGVPPEKLISFMENVLDIKGVRIAGFSTNFGCMAQSRPSMDTLEDYVRLVKDVEHRFGLGPGIVSIGGSVLWRMLEAGRIPGEIDQIRIGESLFLGYDPGAKTFIDTLFQDAFVLEGEIMEVKDVKLDPDAGPLSSSGNNGYQKRALIDFGYTACHAEGLIPLDAGVRIADTSQYISSVDVTNANNGITAGSTLRFLMKYQALSRAMICPYLEKVYHQ